MKKSISLLCLILLMMALGGCQLIRIEEEKRTPLAYTILEQERIPEEIKALIEQKKTTEFQMTYQREKELYLIKGYGQQMSGGYSIQIEELGLSTNAVFFVTRLMGPTEEEKSSEPSYPYIVVKMEYRKEPVQFS